MPSIISSANSRRLQCDRFAIAILVSFIIATTFFSTFPISAALFIPRRASCLTKPSVKIVLHVKHEGL